VAEILCRVIPATHALTLTSLVRLRPR
jgi:hypothetical protein